MFSLHFFMQRLLLKADENSLFAAHLTEEIDRCHRQMEALRNEIAFANRCVSDLEVNMMINGSATESDMESQGAEHQMEATIHRLRSENAQLHRRLRALQQQQLPHQDGQATATVMTANTASASVAATVTVNGVDGGGRQEGRQQLDRNGNCNVGSEGGGGAGGTAESLTTTSFKMKDLELELVETRKLLSSLKLDRKRLKCEKLELLSQMKDVYQTLETKEKELRDFIRQFETKMRDSDHSIQKIIWQKEKAEKDKEKLTEDLEKQKKMVEQLKQEVENERQGKLKLQQEISELRGRFVLITGQPATVMSTSTSSQCTASATVVCAIKDEATSPFCDSVRLLDRRSSVPLSIADTPPDSTPPVVLPFRRAYNKKDFSSSSNGSGERTRLSRFFNRTRSRFKRESADTEEDDPITSDLNLMENANYLVQAREISIEKWRQVHVLAWVKLELGMTQYVKAFEDNVKSGKVLSEMADPDFDHVLGITNPMHKHKLRLAIEEYRIPSLCKFPCVKDVTCHYVVNSFLPAIGLPQYANSFRTALVDGRILNYLNKKQLQKYLGVSRKFHQWSMLKAIELLQILNFDIKALAKRRTDCEHSDTDVLVWTNERLIRWMHMVDLSEYSENLRESGIHGAVMVLDPSFTPANLANVLSIPSGKQTVRRHLFTKLEPILLDARSNLVRSLNTRFIPGLVRASDSPYTRTETLMCGQPLLDRLLLPKRHSVFKGSFGRMFGSKLKRTTSDCRRSMDVSDMNPGSFSSMSFLDDETAGLNLNLSLPEEQKKLNHSTGTLSSTTSDLGSSIERSQHMKTILSTPEVLIQPPITNLASSNAAELSKRSFIKSGSSDAVSGAFNPAEYSSLHPLCLSPGEGNSSFKQKFVRLRRKKPLKGAIGHSFGNAPSRPHSMGDFSTHFTLFNGTTSTPTTKGSDAGSGSGSGSFSESISLRIKDWFSADRLDMMGDDQRQDGLMSTISEQGEFDSDADGLNLSLKKNSSKPAQVPTVKSSNVRVMETVFKIERPKSLAVSLNIAEPATTKSSKFAFAEVRSSHETDL